MTFHLRKSSRINKWHSQSETLFLSIGIDESRSASTVLVSTPIAGRLDQCANGMAIAAAHQAGIWVGMCGELAGNALATPFLLGLGLDEFSMSAPSVPGVKQALRQWTREEAVGVAAAVASYDSASAIQTYLQQIARSVTV